MANLCSKDSDGYDARSAADLDNLRLIRDRNTRAKSDFEALKLKVRGRDTLTFVSFEEFPEMA